MDALRNTSTKQFNIIIIKLLLNITKFDQSDLMVILGWKVTYFLKQVCTRMFGFTCIQLVNNKALQSFTLGSCT